MQSPYKKNRLAQELKEAAARFLEQESSRTSLITVTNAHVSKDGKSAIIFFTVYPESSEKAAISFVKRQQKYFKDFLRKNTRISRIPSCEFRIDEGEKNRQRLDELSN